VPGGISVRTNNLSFPQDSSGSWVAAAAGPPGDSVPGDGSLRITWDAGPPRLVLDGDIDLTSHAVLIVALAEAADGTGQVHIDMAGVSFCDVAGMRIILHGGDGQPPGPAQVTVHNLSPHLEKLLRLVHRDAAPDLATGVAGQSGTSTGHPDVARPREDGSAQILSSTRNEPATSPPPRGRSGAGMFPGPADAARPVPALPRDP
jgi:ABC-type transporter Mla MlaB component